MAPHSSTLAWRVPWMEEPGGLQPMGSLGVGHDWTTSLSLFTFMHWRRKWQPTPVFLLGESQGRGSLVAAVYGVTQSRTRLKWLSIALLRHKREWNYAIFSNMDGSRDCHSKWSKSDRNIVWHPLYMESKKKWYKWTYLQKRNRTYGCQGEELGKAMVREFGIYMYTPLYFRWIKYPVYFTRSYSIAHATLLNIMWRPGWEESLGENGYMYMYGYIPLLSTWNNHIIIWLNSNIKRLKNKKIIKNYTPI